MSRIIGLLGAKGSGKSEVANYLVKHHGFTRLRFADGIKDMLRTLGLTEAQVDGNEKETPIPLLGGKRYRDAATSLGTGWGRDMMDADIWVRALEQKLLCDVLGPKLTRVVIDDVRYPNELAMIRRYDGALVKVRRPLTEPRWSRLQAFLVKHGLVSLSGIHSSEIAWRLTTVEEELLNTYDLAALGRSVDELLQRVSYTGLPT